jgi:hypothetical protein
VKLIFTVSEGPKVKVGTITFTGNHGFLQPETIRSMHHDASIAIPLLAFDVPLMSKTFDKPNWMKTSKSAYAASTTMTATSRPWSASPC